MSASSDRSAASSVPASRNHRDVIASSLFRRQRVPHPPVASPRRAAVAARFRRGRRRINNRAPACLRSFAHAPMQSTRVSMCRTDASRRFRKRRFEAKRRLVLSVSSHCLFGIFSLFTHIRFEPVDRVRRSGCPTDALASVRTSPSH